MVRIASAENTLIRCCCSRSLTAAEWKRFSSNPTGGDSPEDRLLVQLQGMIAEYERAQIAERTRRGKRHRARSGCVNVLSGAPYGYRYIRKTDTSEAYYTVIEAEGEVVRKVFDFFTRKLSSIGAIARKLNQEGIATRFGKSPWERSTVWGMLRNPAYKGRACFGKTAACRAQKHYPASTSKRRVLPTFERHPCNQPRGMDRGAGSSPDHCADFRDGTRETGRKQTLIGAKNEKAHAAARTSGVRKMWIRTLPHLNKDKPQTSALLPVPGLGQMASSSRTCLRLPAHSPGLPR